MYFNYEFNDNNHEGTVVLLHGFMSDRRSMYQISHALSDMFNTLLIDLPGFGSTHIKQCSMDDVIDGVYETIKLLNLTHVHIFGYSMGGRVSIGLVTKYYNSNIFSSLILESTSPGIKDPSARRERQALDDARANHIEMDFNAFLNEWENLPLFNSQSYMDEATKLMQRNNRAAQNPACVANSLRYYGTGVQKYYGDELHKVNIPVLLIVGEKDQKFIKINEFMKNQFSHAILEIVGDAGHNVHLEQPTMFQHRIINFYSEVKHG